MPIRPPGSIDVPLWRALATFRIASMLYAAALTAGNQHHFAQPVAAWVVTGVRLATGPTGPGPTAPTLTARETEILRLVAKGFSYRQIADKLVLSHRTVQNHVQNTLSKLQLHNRVELARYAIATGLDSLDTP
jgi:DNA-binding NarL/FixJ family response regulator